MLELNCPAPNFELADLDGSLHCLSDSRGRIVVLNFWSAECPWAERADRELLSYFKEWGGRVILLTIAANAHEPDLQCAAAARTQGLPFVLRATPEVLDAYAAQTTPHLFVVDTDGILRYRGALDDVAFRQREPTRLFLKDAVETLLAGRLPKIQESAPYGCTIIRFVLESNCD